MGEESGESEGFEELSDLTCVNITEKIEDPNYLDVYFGTDRTTKEKVAVKVETKPDKYHKLLTETALIRTLEHPGLVKYFRSGRGKIGKTNKRFLVQGFAGDFDLDAKICKEGKLEIDQSIDYLVQILNFLDLLHEHNRVFIDLRPQNIIENKDKLKFIDLALVRKNPYKPGLYLGQIAFLCGDWTKYGLITPSTDIYVAGIILYQMLTGKIPYKNVVDRRFKTGMFRDADGRQIFSDYDNARAALYIDCHAKEPRPDIQQDRPELSDKLVQIWQKMMEPDVKYRYSNVKKILSDLDHL